MILSSLLQEASYFIKLTFAVGGWCHSLLWSETTISLILKILVMAKAVSHSWWLPLDICPSLYQGLPKDHLTASCHNILNIWEIIQDRCMLFNISAHHYLRHSMQEWGKQHGIISINAVIIKFHKKILGSLWFPNDLWLFLCGGLPRGHLAAKGCPGFIVKFDNYSLNVDEPM